MNTYIESDSFESQDHSASDLRETLFSYLRYWKWILLSIFVFLILGYVYVKLTTPLYKIETNLLIKDNKGNAGGQNDLLKDLDLFTSDKIIDNEIEILKSKTIIGKVIKDLRLETSYFHTDGVRKREQYADLPFEVQLLKPSATAYETKLQIKLISPTQADINGKIQNIKYPLLTDAGMILIKPSPDAMSSDLLTVKFNGLEDLINDYSEKLKVEAVSKQASVLSITIEDALPKRGIDFLNQLVEEYNNAALEDKNRVTARTLSFIDDRLDKLIGQLGASEKNVEQYKSSNRIANIGTQSQILLQNIGDNDIQLNKVNIQLSVLNDLENYLQKDDNAPSALPSMLGIDDPTLLGLVQQLGETQQKRVALLQTVPETNPLVSSYTDQIKGLKQAINASVQSLKKGLQITQKQLQVKNNSFEGTVKEVPAQERGLLDVMRQQRLRDTLYMYLLQKREATAMELASGVADSRTIDRARSSSKPVKPVKSMIYAVFLLMGCIVPVSIIYIKNLLNFRILRKSDIEKLTSVPIMAEVSHSDMQSTLLVVEKPRSIVAEQIRALRTNLRFIIPNENQKTILFTSSISGEGKSFISLNLGASLVMANKKVVILELDLRKPKLHSGLGINSTEGLSTYLIGKVNYKDILIEIPFQKGYYIIPSGPIPPNPAEILGNGNIKHLIEELKKEFDYIILDAPPVGLVTDAQILGDYVDATMFIVRHNYTAKNYIYMIENFHRNKKFKNLNIILNSIKFQEGYGY
ncbi:MAG: GumC family protein [Mucilaginibacter sp.]